MVSPDRLAANRANAKRSTGPLTAEGKARAAANARRHGLSVSVSSDPALRAEVDQLARRILGPFGDEHLELAQRIAEAQIDLTRVRQARHRLIQRALQDPTHMSARQAVRFVQLMARMVLLDDADRDPEADAVLEETGAMLNPTSDPGAEWEARRLAEFARELASLDRYERRVSTAARFQARRAAQKSATAGDSRTKGPDRGPSPLCACMLPQPEGRSATSSGIAGPLVAWFSTAPAARARRPFECCRR